MTGPTSIMPLALGSVMGHEFSGEVVAAGKAAADSWKTGDRVAGFPYICCGDASPCRNLFFGNALCGKGLTIGLGQSHGAYGACDDAVCKIPRFAPCDRQRARGTAAEDGRAVRRH